ncbi:hypothetical protein MKW92_031489 [Papaver armeniacum]|nr:hypothetical protein MKW92_031489 [Papaver armeniacum]
MTLTHFSQRKQVTAADPEGDIGSSMDCQAESMDPIQQAELDHLLSSLDPTIPSFVKHLIWSHVLGGFHLGIPSKFCAENKFAEKDFLMTLLDEKGNVYTAKYLTNDHRLSAGWRGFANYHKLAVGDVAVFQLINIDTFKVYIIKKTVRTTGLAEVGGAFGRPPPEACVQESSLGKAGNDMKPKRKTVSGKPKCLHSSVIEGENENISPPQSVIDQPENCSEKTHLDYLKGISLASSVPEFEKIKNLESFTIIYNDLILDLVISAYTRSRYYELCCSQKSFLHKTLLPGLNFHIAVGLINETVNIADAIKSSQVSGTSMDKFQVWKKSLKASKGYGMNVGFLLRLLKELMKMASESEQAVDLSESKKRSSKSEKEIISSRTVKKKKKMQ